MDASSWNERYRTAELVWGAEPNQFIRQQCEDLPIGYVVDLGCGEGRNALWLARLGWNVVGIDSSDVAIERARGLAQREPDQVARRLVWRVADITTHPLGRSEVDLVVISYVHLPPASSRQLWAAAARAVKPAGHLVLVGHDARNLVEGAGGPQYPELLHVPADVGAALAAEGLVVELATTVERLTDDGVALDTLVRARRPRTGSEAAKRPDRG